MLILFFTIIFLAELIIASWIITQITKARRFVCEVNQQVTDIQPLIKENIDIAHEKCELTQILEKGNIRSKEEYSVMDNHLSSLILLRAIGLYKIQQIDVCGIAGDYCVKESIEGLLKHGLKDNICVLKDFCPSIDDGTVLNNFIAENGLKSI